MNTFNFKKLELGKEGSWIQKTVRSVHFKKTLILSVIGAIFGYALFYFGQEAGIREFWDDGALSNMLLGAGFGIFITNSPCSRGRC